MSYGIIFIALFSFFLQQNPALAAKKSYVVYLGEHLHRYDENFSEEESTRITDSHYELLGEILGDKDKAQNSIFYSYTHYINGFAAILEEDTALKITKYRGVVSVFENRGYKLHTTRSWKFLGLQKNGMIPANSLWNRASFGEGTIIANFDTGVWPESESFKDEGFGPVPSKWRGICQNDMDPTFSCNRKLIGARYFNKGFEAALGTPLNSTFQTPRDLEGHGSHTLSTAAGRFVPNVNIYGFGNGTAKGGSPHARVAVYKVCWPPINGSQCYDADILAAYDAAIHDGVDVLSISLGGPPSDYFTDGIAIGSFHAVKNGISVICSAGNSGPHPGTVSNLAPWILTVGASTMDREFPTYVLFGNKRLKGESLSATSLSGNKIYPMISSINAQAANRSAHDAELCFLGSIDPDKVKGKIVVCLRGINARVEKGETVLQAGGVGMVLANDNTTGNEIIADAHVLPATHITYSDGLILFSYLNSTGQSAIGFITKPTTRMDTKPAPFMAAFSSQGPNTITPNILKPDITAPGVSVIAAYTRASGPTGLAFDKRRVSYNSESGTSMSCPHISGVIGLLKTLYPDWSPAAIKSAIMTTATIMDNVGGEILNASFVTATPFSYGSGHINPNGAMDPGLVYDLTITDYINFLCALGYNSTQFAKFETDPYKCPSKPPKFQDMNYPSISITNLTSSAKIARTVKNVGPPGLYTARVVNPTGVRVTVTPKILRFKEVGEEKKFKVKFKNLNAAITSNYVYGSLTWCDGIRYVRSPLVVNISG